VNRVWIEIARSDIAQRFATWPWRLGLGWLVGRRLALVSTNAPQGAVRRTLVPAHIIGGDVLLAGLERAHWQEDITARSTINVQAHPGPLAARVEPLGDSGGDGVRWYRATATGAPAPEMIGPDQIWFWAVAPILWGLRRLRE
jgi:hypothetical protein